MRPKSSSSSEAKHKKYVWKRGVILVNFRRSLNSVQTRGIVKTSEVTRVFVKIGDFIKFEGFLVEFQENKRCWENQEPRKSPEKWIFWPSPFTMHLVCTLLILY